MADSGHLEKSLSKGQVSQIELGSLHLQENYNTLSVGTEYVSEFHLMKVFHVVQLPEHSLHQSEGPKLSFSFSCSDNLAASALS